MLAVLFYAPFYLIILLVLPKMKRDTCSFKATFEQGIDSDIPKVKSYHQSVLRCLNYL